jgi:hypothetical protein
MSTPVRQRRWFQYSLRTLVVFVTLCAIACSWVAVKMKHAREQREAAEAIAEFGAWMKWSEPSGPRWVRQLMGDDPFRDVTMACLPRDGFTDSRLGHLKGLSQLQCLILYETNVTDVGMENLRGLRQLQHLILARTGISDAGLEPIKSLSQLRELDLEEDKLTEEGVNKLQLALPKCKISWSHLGQ